MGLAESLDGRIVRVCVVRVTKPWSFNKAVIAVNRAIGRRHLWGPHRGDIEALTIEHPRVYPGMGRLGSAKDVEKLGDLAKRLKATFKPTGIDVDLVRPSAWKGQVPKPVHHKRVRAELDERELALLEGPTVGFGDAEGDVWDAVGIELFKLGRLGRGGTRR
jgi:hypothetical protein